MTKEKDRFSRKKKVLHFYFCKLHLELGKLLRKVKSFDNVINLLVKISAIGIIPYILHGKEAVI